MVRPEEELRIATPGCRSTIATSSLRQGMTTETSGVSVTRRGLTSEIDERSDSGVVQHLRARYHQLFVPVQ
jgi:hypothetical protein